MAEGMCRKLKEYVKRRITMKKFLRNALFPLALVLVFLHATSIMTLAGEYPKEPITLIVPYGPGGTDREARFMAPKMAEILGQSVLVENKSGGGGSIGTNYVVRSKPDGYTFLYGAVTTLSLTPHINKKLPYGNEDLIPLASTSWLPNLLAVGTNTPWNSIEELLSYAKKNPGGVKLGSAGTGTAVHFAIEAFAAAAEIKITHVPFKGTGQAITNTVGGHVHGVFSMPQAVVPQVKAGNLRVLGVFAKQRFEGLPDVPTLNEAGVPVNPNAGTNRLGIFAPKETPREICDKISNTVKQIITDPETVAQLKKMQSLPHFLGQEEFSNLAKDQWKMYKALIEKIGL